MKKLFIVKDLPEDIPRGSKIEINNNNVTYFTHGFFKYPCKFIPQIPRWAIFKYTKENDYVLDPFAGSGTTLVEAVINNRKALGVDFDKLSNHLCDTKTALLTKRQINNIHIFLDKLTLNGVRIEKNLPNLNNTSHWFPKEKITELTILKEKIENFHKKRKNRDIYNFLKTCFASIIRRVSYADDTSPKPYVSRRIKKHPKDVKQSFISTCKGYLRNIEKFNIDKVGVYRHVGNEARDIDTKRYFGRISLVVTSPPYINAFDYVRSLRLENAWLGFYEEKDFIKQKRKQIGTEQISFKTYTGIPKKTNVKDLDLLVSRIYKKDKKRAHIVKKYFSDIRKNLKSVNKLLKANGHYVLVVGNSKIRGINIPTNILIGKIAENCGYRIKNEFSYIIKNRYLRIPRGGRGGFIKYDYVLDLKKYG